MAGYSLHPHAKLPRYTPEMRTWPYQQSEVASGSHCSSNCGTFGKGTIGMLENWIRSTSVYPCAYLRLVWWCSGGPQPMMMCKMQENKLVWDLATDFHKCIQFTQKWTISHSLCNPIAQTGFEIQYRVYLFFFSLDASFHGRIRESMKRDLLNPFLQLPWPLLKSEVFGVCFLSAEHHLWGCLLPHMLLFFQLSTHSPWPGVTGTAANLGFLAAPPQAALGWWVIAATWPHHTAYEGSNPITSLPIKCISSH